VVHREAGFNSGDTFQGRSQDPVDQLRIGDILEAAQDGQVRVDGV